MFQLFNAPRHVWEDLGAAVLALAYVGGFLLAVNCAFARLLFRSAF
ncbi:hypothetical protein [Roseicella aquatilis]|nr:hypothetical protein [Roseicella aquatilis]